MPSCRALFLNWPITTFLSLTTSLTGLVMYANLSSCDPLLRSDETNVKTLDQLLPYYVVQSLGQYPGIPGLFVAGIFSGALSTVSSSVNSLATVTLEDFIKPVVAKRSGEELSDRKSTLLCKVLACSYGFLCVALTYVVEKLGGVLQASLTIFGVVGGPLLGIFTLGMIFKNANQKGALVGFSFALLFCLFIGFGALVWGESPEKLPSRIDGCLSNSSFINNVTEAFILDINDTEIYVQTTVLEKKTVYWLFKLSYLWYASIGWLMTILIGLLFSAITGGTKYIDPTLLSPVVRSWKICSVKKTPLEAALEEYEEETRM